MSFSRRVRDALSDSNAESVSALSLPNNQIHLYPEFTHGKSFCSTWQIKIRPKETGDCSSVSISQASLVSPTCCLDALLPPSFFCSCQTTNNRICLLSAVFPHLSVEMKLSWPHVQFSFRSHSYSGSVAPCQNTCERATGTFQTALCVNSAFDILKAVGK